MASVNAVKILKNGKVNNPEDETIVHVTSSGYNIVIGKKLLENYSINNSVNTEDNSCFSIEAKVFGDGIIDSRAVEGSPVMSGKRAKGDQISAGSSVGLLYQFSQ